MDPTLKQRLVGTAVLVALAVIFVPMLLDGPVDPVEESRVTGVPLELPEPLPEPTASIAPDTNTVVAEPESAPRQAGTEAANPGPAASGFAIQLGAFRDAAAAEALVARLRAQSFDAFVMSGEGWHRVRVGPVAERAVAEALAVRIHRAIGEPTQVVTHP